MKGDSSSESTAVKKSGDGKLNQELSKDKDSSRGWTKSIFVQKARSAWLYLVVLTLLLVLVICSVFPDAIFEVTSSVNANVAYRTYVQYFLLWISGLLFVISYHRGLVSKHSESESKAKIKFYKHEIDYLLGRSDNLDKVVNYQRSGVSILTAVFVAVIAWILDLSSGRILNFIELILIMASCVLVLSGVISLLTSFGKTTVGAKGWFLDESLLRTGQPDNVFVAQLAGVVQIKANMIEKIKDIIGKGLLFFIFIIGVGVFQPSYNSVQLFIQFPLVWIFGLISYGALLFLVVAFASAVVSILGIDTYMDITKDLEEENNMENA